METILVECVIIGNGKKPHQTRIGFRSFGLDELVVGRPVDEFRTAPTSKTGIMKMGLKLGNFVERESHEIN